MWMWKGRIVALPDTLQSVLIRLKVLKLVTLTADLLTCMNAYTPRRNSMFEDPLPGDDLRGPPRPFRMYDGMLPVICDFSFCERGLERASVFN